MKAINLKFGKEKVSSDDFSVPTALNQKVTGALAAANGLATAHTFTDLYSVNKAVVLAEEKLTALHIPKNIRVGAVVTVTSGDPLPSAYKYSRTVTKITLERRASGWWLVAVAAVTAYQQGGKTTVILNEAQDAAAVAALRSNYFCNQG